MKHEYAGKIINEGEFEKVKVYSLKTVDGGEKNIYNSFIRYDEYEYMRTNTEVIRNDMR